MPAINTPVSNVVTMWYDLNGETRKMYKGLVCRGYDPGQALDDMLARMRAEIRERGGEPGSYTYYWLPDFGSVVPIGT